MGKFKGSFSKATQGACICFLFKGSRLGKYFLMNLPSGSNFSDCKIGLKILNQGCASHPVDAAHYHPPLFAAKSKSMRLSAKYFSPQRQSINKSLTRKDATIILKRLCIKPV